MRFSMIFIFVGFLFLSSCKQVEDTSASLAEPSQSDMTNVKAEIQALETAWATAQNAKDINALMAMYADDAISMPDGAPILNGKTAIQAKMAEEFASVPDGLTSVYTVQDVYGDANTVTEVGTGVTTDSTGAVVRTGKYVAIWQKRDGKYLCIREIYNNDAPTK
ncbi:MAG: nuclear transport factor 2 family protein [Saprospiraceae bacterium]|nr:nuclear transport factor 2 family protein [Saprospiraceae bacterium]